MATSRPPARKPTKAAALTALGITQDDLDLLEDLKRSADEAKALEEAPEPEISPFEFDEAQVTPVPREVTLKKPSDSPDVFIRNLRYTDISFRLSRQRKQGERRTELKPRGQRGDLVRLNPGDLEDSELITQMNYGLVEIITAVEARKVIEGQATNAQQAIHPALSMLRNELGQQYGPDAIKVEEEYSKQGIVVAQLKPQGGGAGEIEINRQGIVRQQPRGIVAPVGGNPAIVSDGFADAAAQADAIARRKDIEGPAAGLGNVNVTIEPTQRT